MTVVSKMGKYSPETIEAFKFLSATDNLPIHFDLPIIGPDIGGGAVVADPNALGGGGAIPNAN